MVANLPSSKSLPDALPPKPLSVGKASDLPHSHKTPERPAYDRHKWKVEGETYGLYWGDVHRHTDVSNCRTGFDGCIVDHFRYAYDLGKIDFLGTSDHTDIGKIYHPYEWWHNQRMHDALNSPGEFNTVYVYEERNGTWNLDFSNVGTDFENVTPLSYGAGLTDRSTWTYSNLTYINVYSTYTQYGYSVQMSAFGEHIIVGAPGTRFLQIDSTNSDATQVYQSNTHIIGTTPPPIFTNNKGNYQSGHARIFKCPNEGDWTSGVTQVGQLLRGDPDGNRLDYWDHYRTSLPGFGFNTHISYDGNTILVTSVEQGVRSESVDYNTSAGRVSYYTYNTLENTWEHQQNITGGIGSLTGWGSALSYDGVRIGHTELNKSLFTKLYDWNGLAFYDVSLPISGISGYNYQQSTLLGYDFAMVNGKYAAVSAPYR